MRIIPKRKIVFTTKISKEEVLRKLSESTRYKGTTDHESFNISRIINYRNSFLPQIKGKIHEDYNATKIEATMEVSRFVLIFMAIWFTSLLVFSATSIINLSFSNLDMFHLIPFGMMIFGALLLHIPFSIECKISEKDLQQIFEAETVRKY